MPAAGDPNLIAPNLAQLAKESVDFRRAYTSYPVCCPSRAAMLTGKFPRAAGVTKNHTLLPLLNKTLPEALKGAGYRTGFIGKWHLDGRENPGFVPQSRRRGFDYWAAYNISHKQFDSVYFRDSPTPVEIHGFEPTHLTNLAIDFIQQASTQPFYLYLSWVAPHPPLTPPPSRIIYDPGQIQLRPNVPLDQAGSVKNQLAGYYGLCTAVDENLGRLLAALAQIGLAENTIVVFTSDHGYAIGSHGLDEIDQPYEECTRIPLLFRYPARLKPRVESDALISNIDFAPTLLGLCGMASLPGMQGLNLASWMTGGHGSAHKSVYAEGDVGTSGEWKMVVSGQYKLVANSTLEPTHFYDLNTDPYETNNLAAKNSYQPQRKQLLKLLTGYSTRNARIGATWNAAM